RDSSLTTGAVGVEGGESGAARSQRHRVEAAKNRALTERGGCSRTRSAGDAAGESRALPAIPSDARPTCPLWQTVLASCRGWSGLRDEQPGAAPLPRVHALSSRLIWFRQTRAWHREQTSASPVRSQTSAARALPVAKPAVRANARCRGHVPK